MLMIRKFTLLFLLCFGLHSIGNAQTAVLDSVTIYLPFGTDTTCPSQQLTFTAVQSNDTFSTTTYRWYTDGTYTGVSQDTFYTTALVTGDSVWCWIYYTNSAGPDSFRSNTIVIYRSDTIMPHLDIALTTGSNPGCGSAPLTFTAFPINGGSAPSYQWEIDRAAISGETNSTFTAHFVTGDTVSCQMISNSACLGAYNDTVISNYIVIFHDSLNPVISIVDALNPICAGTRDSFTVTYSGSGIGATLSWYVDSTLVPAAISPVYATDSLHDHDLVYCVLNAPDPCVINHTTVSNIITMTVIPDAATSAYVVMTHGANPSCLDSTVTLTPYFVNFGHTPSYTWLINGIPVSTDSVLDTVFANNDLVSFRVNQTDSGCYTHDTVLTPPILMIRDSTPPTPWLSLIGNQLEVNNGGNYQWYLNGNLIVGAINQTFHPSVEGNYYVIKDSAGCPSLPSNVIYISLLAVKNISSAGAVNLYPNPVSGTLNLDWGKQVVHMKMDLYNIVGQAVLHEEIDGQSHHETDLSRLPPGAYMVVLQDSDGNKATFKIDHTQ